MSDEAIVLEVERLTPAGVRTESERVGVVRYLSAPAYVRLHHATEGRTLGSIVEGLVLSGHDFAVQSWVREVPLLDWCSYKGAAEAAEE